MLQSGRAIAVVPGGHPATIRRPLFLEELVVKHSEVPSLIDTYEHGARTALDPRFSLSFS